MPRAGPKKTQRYSLEFKRTAVRLSQRPGMQVQVVAEALDIHPFMLSRWRKEFREGRLRPSTAGPRAPRVQGTVGPGAAPAPGVGGRASRAAGGARPAKKSHPILFRSKAAAFAFIDTQRGTIAVTRLCALYQVTRTGCCAWRRRPASDRSDRQDHLLLRAMRPIFDQSGGTYGSPRMHRALHALGYRLSRRRVERLMRTQGWRGRAARLYRRTTGTHRWFGQHPESCRSHLAHRAAIKSGWGTSRISRSAGAGGISPRSSISIRVGS